MSSRVIFGVNELSSALYDKLFNSKRLLSQSRAKENSSVCNSKLILFKSAIIESRLTILLIACLPKPTGNLTECTVTTNDRTLTSKFDFPYNFQSHF